MMQVKIFTMPFNSQLGVFDDEEFNSFIKDKELVSANDYLFQRDEIPYLTLVVKYKQLASVVMSASNGTKPQEKTKNNEEWRKLLDDESMPLFNTLRQWRSEKSKKDGVPPYVILNNRSKIFSIRRGLISALSSSTDDLGYSDAEVVKKIERLVEYSNH